MSVLRQRLTGLPAGFTFTDIPSQAGKRAVVTGANSGIGFEVCRRLLEHGLSELVMGARNNELVEQAAEDLHEQFPDARISAKHLDLADFKSVARFAEEVLSDDKPIHLLVNDAGRYIDTPKDVTPDGFEIQHKTNYYSHVYLTQLLLPRIVNTPGARIINLSSMAEMFGRVHWDDLKGAKIDTSGIFAYGRSKLFFLMYSYELHRRLQQAGYDVQVFATHPGLVRTGLFNKIDPRMPFAIVSFIAGLLLGLDPVAGSMSTLYAATQPNLTGGKFIGPSYILNTFTTLATMPWNAAARDPELRAKLFDATLNIVRESTGTKLPQVQAH